MLQIMGAENAATVEEHVCINNCYCFPKLEAYQWKHHMDNKCTHCHEKRYKLVLAGTRRARRLVPRNRFWYFGLGRSIGDNMFGNSSWCRHRNADGQQDFHDYKTSAKFARLKEQQNTV